MNSTKTVFLAILSCLCMIANSQVIHGTVVDSATGIPLPYVNISIPGTFSGTLTNSNGLFEIDISNVNSKQDSLQISQLSYKKLSIPVALLQDSTTYALAGSVYTLNEAIVSPQPPEEYIKEAIRRIPENTVDTSFNTKVYYRMVIKLNGKYMSYTEAIMNAYNPPVVSNGQKDSARLQLIAMKYVDEQEAAIKTAQVKKRKSKQAEIDTALIGIVESLVSQQGPYALIDTSLTKRWYYSTPERVLGDYHFRFKNVQPYQNRKLLNIGFGDKKKEKNDKEQGHVYIEENSYAIESYRYKVAEVPSVAKAALLLFGYNMNDFNLNVKSTSQPTDSGYIPQLAILRFIVQVDKIKMFKSNIPLNLEIEAVMTVLEHEIPFSNPCTDGIILKRGEAVHEQAEPDPNHPVWNQYKGVILPEGGRF